MQEKSPPAGVWSAFGTFFLLLGIAIYFGGTAPVLADLGRLLTGDALAIPVEHVAPLFFVLAVISNTVLVLPCTIVSLQVPHRILGDHGKHALNTAYANMQPDAHFLTSFTGTFLEEAFARWLFLGVLAQLPLFSGTIGFYTLFLLGNGIWALQHLSNYEDVSKRHWLRVLPQFVAGAFYTVLYVRHGFLASVLAHFASNAILDAFRKEQRLSIVDALIVGYLVTCAIVSYLWMEKPLTDIYSWFALEPTFVLPGWGAWDYLKVSVFISSCIGIVVSGVLLYDRGATHKEEKKELNAEWLSLTVMSYIIASPISILLILGAYYLLGLIIADTPTRILSVSLLLAFMHKQASMSAVARTFWTVLPHSYIGICILLALPWWDGLCWLFAGMLIFLPQAVLNQLDD